MVYGLARAILTLRPTWLTKTGTNGQRWQLYRRLVSILHYFIKLLFSLDVFPPHSTTMFELGITTGIRQPKDSVEPGFREGMVMTPRMVALLVIAGGLLPWTGWPM